MKRNVWNTLFNLIVIFTQMMSLTVGVVGATPVYAASDSSAAFKPSATLSISNGMAASLVLGQPDFVTKNTSPTQTRNGWAQGVAVDPTTGKVFVSDWSNSRVLRYASAGALANGAAAEVVLGQPDFTSSAIPNPPTAASMYNPMGVHVDAAGVLWVADGSNNRVLRFDSAATKVTGASADGVLGQSTFTANGSGNGLNQMGAPIAITSDATGRIWVGEGSNNRVLRFDAAAGKANGASAEVQLTQTQQVWGVYADQGGRLWVSQSQTVLRYDSAATLPTGVNTPNASLGSGVAGATQNSMYPAGLTAKESGGQVRLFVADLPYNRVMIFNDAVNKSNGANADNVIGQANFTSSAQGLTNATFFHPVAVQYDPTLDVLWVADRENYRVLMFGTADNPDIVAPAVDTFTATSPASSLNIPITSFTASDDTAVTGYKITESATPPGAGDGGWSGTYPTTYTVATDGSYTLYPWAKDAAGNVSAVYGSPVSVTVDTPIFTTGMNATLVLGKPDFVTSDYQVTQSGLAHPQSVAVDPTTGKVFVSDIVSHRILRFPSVTALYSGMPAEAVLGQINFTASTSATAQNRLYNPGDVSVDSAGRLWVSELGNNRILRFDNASSKASGANADGVLGQSNFTSSGQSTSQSGMKTPSGIFVDSSGNLWVADWGNHRVLRFDNAAAKADGANADGVLGQTNFTSNSAVVSQNGLAYPWSVYEDSAGRLWVGDQGNRILRFDSATSKSNGANADGVLGLPPGYYEFVGGDKLTQNRVEIPFGITGDETTGQIFVSDSQNRILIFDNAASLASGANASTVLGQPNFTTSTPATTQSKTRSPRKIFFDPATKVLLVADETNRRVLMFGRPNDDYTAPVVTAFTLPATSSSLNVAISTFTVSEAVGAAAYIFTTTSTPPTALDSRWSGDVPTYVTLPGNGANTVYPWVKDAAGNISAVFGSPPSVTVTLAHDYLPGSSAFLVLGQPNFTSSATALTQTGMYSPGGVAVDPTTGKVFVADGNHRVLRYGNMTQLSNGIPAEAVFGQSSFTVANCPGSPTASSMCSASGVYVDSAGRLWVADSGNYRVLRFDNASTKTSGSAADGVLGQANFTSNVNNVIAQNSMLTPISISGDSTGRIWVADSSHHRVLRFDNAAAKANGANADGVLGQPDFDFASGAQGLSNKFNAPTSVVADASGRIWVADSGNNRVLRFDNAATKANGASADAVLAQKNFVNSIFGTTVSQFSTARGVAYDDANDRLFVADYGNSRIMVFDDASTKANGDKADSVIGQTNFSGSTFGTTASTLKNPMGGLYFDSLSDTLLVVDTNNSRILAFGAVPDSSATPPALIYFTAPAASGSLTVPVNSFLASDIAGVAGYKITESSTPPSAGGGGWSGTAPTTYTVSGGDGSYTLYPWAKDSDENVSTVFASPVTVAVCVPTTITVTSANDSGAGTLRQVLSDSCPNGTVDFDSGLSGQIIRLATPLTVSKNVTIDGSALALQLTLSGDTNNDTTGDTAIMAIQSGVTVSIDALTLTKGMSSCINGYAGISNSGTLTVNHSTFSYNDATNCTTDGGAIKNLSGATLTVKNSTFANNAARSGGAILNDSGTANITNSTFYNNTATDVGGAIANNGTGIIYLRNNTIANNAAPNIGSGVAHWGGTPVTHMTNNIIADNTGAANCGKNVGSVSTNVKNIIESNLNCGTPAYTYDPILGPLAGNGGPTQTMALGANSPALNTGSSCTAAPVSGFDQRGEPRDSFCDIGAYEGGIDTANPDVTVEQAAGQTDPTYRTTLNYTVTFSEFMDPATFINSDVTFNGTAGGTLAAVVTEIAPNDGTKFNIAVTGMNSTGTVIVSLDAGKVTDISGNTNNASTSSDNTMTFNYDASAPTTTIDTQPANPNNDSTPTFTFSGDDGAGGGVELFECNIDGAAYATCVSPYTSAALGDGSHTFYARAVDYSGNTDATPASYTWTVDTAAPSVSISSTAGSAFSSASISVTITFNQNVTGFDSTDIALTNATLSNFTGSNASYSFDLTPSAEGATTVNIATNKAQDAAGNDNTAASQFSRTYDVTAPTTSITGQPSDPNNDTTPTFTFSGADVSGSGVASYQCKVDGGSYALCSSPFTSTTLTDGSHTFYVYAVDAAGNSDATPASYTWMIDNIVPDTSITAQPADPTISTSALFSFSGDALGGSALASFECQLDSSGYSVCTSSKSYTSLTNGSHTFYVRSIDTAGNTDTTPASYTWLVDLAAPTTSITAQPADPINSTSASFSFSGADTSGSGVASYECQIDGGGFSACSSPKSYTTLTEGSHTFDVQAIDVVGNTDASPASYTWAIDLTAPTTSITGQPSDPNNDTTPTFTFSGADVSGSGVGTYQCKIDSGSPALCTSPFTSTTLADGSHTFYVYAVDNAGNSDATPDSYTWMIDNAVPDTSITANPTNPTASTSASFSFSGDALGGSAITSYECQIDGGAYAACTSPKSYTSLTNGSHTVNIHSIDAAGNTDSTPATYTWLVDLVAPTTTISAQPANPTNSTSASFSFSGTDTSGSGVASYECQIDSGGYSACSSPKSYTTLTESSHTFDVRAVDAVGNTDATPDSYTWDIDLTTTDTSITAQPANPTNGTSASFSFSGDPGTGSSIASYECQIDGGGYTTCTSPKSYTSLADGSHTFDARSIDTAGNTDSTPASYTWVVDTTVPDTSITAQPANPINSASASFSFSGDPGTGTAIASYECQLDSGGYSACTSSKSYTSIADGSHTFYVRAIDAAANTDNTVASYTWVVDTTDPNSTISANPSNPTTSTAPSFTFSATDTSGSGVASYECKLDADSYAACTSAKSYTSLADGTHNFYVRAIDNAGNTEASVASFTWVIDTTAPDTSITANPASASNSTSASFSFSGNDGSGVGSMTYECKLDAGSYGVCTSPVSYSSLAESSHTFYVRAADSLANTDATAASYTWTVDTTNPTTAILTTPSNPSINAATPFTFSGADIGGTGVASFLCKMDAGSYVTCSSPFVPFDLTEGTHIFYVKAVDAAGNEDAAPESYTWIADTTTRYAYWKFDEGTGTSATDSSDNSYNATLVNGFAWNTNGAPLSFSNPASLNLDGKNGYVQLPASFPNVSDFSFAGWVYWRGGANAQHIFDFGSGATSYMYLSPKDTSGKLRFAIKSPASATVTSIESASALPQDEWTHVAFVLKGNSGALYVNGQAANFGSVALDPYQVIGANSWLGRSNISANTYFNGCMDDVRVYNLGLSSGQVDIMSSQIPPSGSCNDVFAPQTTITAKPDASTFLPDASFSFASDETGGTFECQLNGGGYSACASPKAYAELTDGNYTFDVRAIDSSSNTDATPASYTWTVLPTPNTVITGGQPANPGNLAAASFTFNSPDDGSATFECKLDAGAWAACTSPRNLTALTAITHTFRVRAKSLSGGYDPTPASFTWLVDLTAPNTTITTKPDAKSRSTDASFAFTSSETGGTFECKLDGGSFATCVSPQDYTSLAQGNHTFEVRAIDAATNTDATPAVYAWVIDSVEPDTTINTQPLDPTTTAISTFTFTSSEAGSTLYCTVDNALAQVCASPKSYTTLQDGSHTFTVFAMDSFGNADSTPDTYTWVTGSIPETAITGGQPANPTNINTASITFNSPDDGTATFECKLDASAWAVCISPKNYASLSSASHTFQVRGKSIHGIYDPTPASYIWVVDKILPDTIIGSKPAALTASDAPSFVFTSNEAGATFECQMDGGGFAACTSPQNYTALASSAHTFQVKSTDLAGNVDATPASYIWTVDTIAPDTTINAQPVDPNTAVVSAFTFSSADTTAKLECRLDAGTWAACTSPKSYSGLVDGSHTFDARGKDPVGNADDTPASVTWVTASIPETAITGGQPSNPTNLTTASFTFNSPDDGTATFECKLDAGAWAACTNPKAYTALTSVSHTFNVRAKSALKIYDTTPAAYTWTVDAIAPDTSFAAKPNVLEDSASASFAFTSTETNSTFECKLDGDNFAACTTPQNFTSLGEGSHTFTARAIDIVGNMDATPVTFTWTVDTIAPDTTINTQPANPNLNIAAVFTFSSADATAVFECELDSGGYAACTSPKTYAVLADDLHIFHVRAKDAVGNTDASPAAFEWTNNSVPETSITGGQPLNPTNASVALFTFNSPDHLTATFECKINGGAWVACASPKGYAALYSTIDTFNVRARSVAGIYDPTPDTYTWVVDVIAPNTALSSKPAALSASDSATFTFTGSETDGSFECKLDGGGFSACASPNTLTGLTSAPHTFQARAVDKVGNIDATPASYTWTVDVDAPNAVIDTEPVSPNTATSSVFTFSSADATAKLECQLDGGGYAACISPKTYSGLQDGAHIFDTRAKDPAGNVDESPDSVTWITASVPDTAITGGEANPANISTASFTFNSPDDNTATFECKMDAGAWAACISPKNYTALSSAAHTFQVRAKSALKIYDPTPDTYSWSVDTILPETTLVTKPAALAIVDSASFTFTASESGSFECKLDNSGFSACTSPQNHASLSEGSHAFQVRAVDEVNNADATPASYAWIVDTITPDTTINSQPADPNTNVVSTFTFSSADATAKFECQMDSGGYAACASPKQYPGLSDGSHTFDVRAKDPAGNTDATPASYTWVNDFVPETSITGGQPLNPTNITTAAFTFNSPDDGSATFECKLDAGAWAACSSPKNYAALTSTSHTFNVRAKSVAGIYDPSPSSYTWIVDTVLPDTTISGKPAALSPSDSAAITFTSNESGSTFECKLDGASFSACASPQNYTGLSEGAHTFSVKSIDATGNVDASPATYSWMVDTLAPDTAINSQPSDPNTEVTSKFTFTSADATAKFECQLDGGGYAACISPKSYSGLVNGSHTFEVRAKDLTGNADASPATFTWVTASIPDTSITGGQPDSSTNLRTASFNFESPDDATSTFECKLDASAWAACASPRSYVALTAGLHTFNVRARSVYGIYDPSPATYTWTVDFTAPDTIISAKPAVLVASDSATFGFTSNESAATFECQLDGGGYAACSNPKNYASLTDSAHIFNVRAVDAAGNTDVSPAIYTWTADIAAPNTTISSRPSDPNTNPTSVFNFFSSESPATFECRIDGGSYAACLSPKTYTGLVDGSHTFDVRAKDAIGNMDATPDTYTWLNTSIPETAITGGPGIATTGGLPAVLTNIVTASFTFNSPDDNTATFECKLDASAWAACISPKNYSALSSASHTFNVRAKSAFAALDPTPSTHTWVVDAIVPNTTIVSKPAAVSMTNAPEFTFTSTEVGSTFLCQIDGGGFSACPTPKNYSGLSDGSHTFMVKAVDTANNTDATPAAYTWVSDTTAPDTSIGTNPTDPNTLTSATFIFSSPETTAKFECQLDGGSYALCTSPKTYTALIDGSHTFNVRAKDVIGNTDASPSTYTWLNAALPETSLTGGQPSNPTNTATAAFTFNSPDDATATFECKLDASTWAVCTSPKSYSGLSSASHTFNVRAKSALNMYDPSPDSYTWVVDTVAPNTAIDSKPSSFSASDSASFTFTATEAGSTFECKLDAGSYAACTSPQNYTSLSDGSHTFNVRALDTLGNTDATPASHVWVVDTTAPDTSINTQPANPNTNTVSAFTFSSAETTSVFECQIDGGGYASCVSPKTYTLADGSHTFDVRAKDPVGNTDSSVASFSWVNDSTPDTAITGGQPAALTNSAAASFTFNSPDHVAATFECKMDAGTWAVCVSPKSYAGLSSAEHTFTVRAKSAYGVYDPTPESYTWTVDTLAPDTNISAKPALLTANTSASFTFSATEAGSSFECKLDAGSFAACTSPQAYSSLTSASHNFQVRAIDTAGNIDSTPASYNWTVDTVAPDTTINTQPVDPTYNSASTFTFSSADATAKFECQIDGGGYSVCVSPKSYAGLTDGSHTFETRAKDVVGNTDATPASYTWVSAAIPETSITGGQPASLTNVNTATFTFTSLDAGAVTFECKMDAGAWAVCSSPKAYTAALVSGSHTFQVRAKTAFGIYDPTPDSYTWVVDTITPNTTIASKPDALSSTNAPAFTFTSNEAGSTFECKLDAGSYAACPSPQNYSSLSEGGHTFSVRAVDMADNRDGTPAAFTWSIDTIAPETALNTQPVDPNLNKIASFTFSSADTTAKFECQMDGGSYAACTSPKTYTLEDGSHTLNVRAKDPTGNVDASPATFTWLNTALPETAITGGQPAALTNITTASFTFNSPDDGTASFECKLDAGAFAACASPKTYSALTSNSHIFQVRAKSAFAAYDPSPDTYTWVVDAIVPDTSISAKPLNPISSTNAGFTFSATEAGSTLECKLDAGGFAACTSPQNLTTLAEGSHTFQMRGIDLAGNIDVTPASHTWVVDTTAPETTLNTQPADPSSNKDAIFTFSSVEGGVKFECQLDGGGYADCVSPKTYLAIADGSHTFNVRAKDGLGNIDATPSAYTWTNDSLPQTAITGGQPASLTKILTASFAFNSPNHGSATFECKLDTGAWGVCTSPKSYIALTSAAHTFSVRAKSAYGVYDPTPSEYSWVVDTVWPITTINSSQLSGTSMTVSFTANKAGATFECKLDSGSFTACTSPQNMSGLTEAGHRFEVRAIDPAENTGNPAGHAFTVDTISPDTSITSFPPNGNRSSENAFRFTGTDANLATFECQLDSEPWVNCASINGYTLAPGTVTYRNISEGTREFKVRGVDQSGNKDLTPASYTWVVNQFPETTIVVKPSVVFQATDAYFQFFSPFQDNTGFFECKLDTGNWTRCGTGSANTYGYYSNLALGTHTFSVRSSFYYYGPNIAANVYDPTPATYTWTIVPPLVITLATPSVSGTSATLNMTANKPNTNYFCSLDSGSWQSCANPKTYTGLSLGTHQVRVYGEDEYGNKSTEATQSLSVDTLSPTVTSMQLESAPLVPASLTAGSVKYYLRFSEGVKNVDAADFLLVKSSGLTGSYSVTVTVTETSSSAYTVRVNFTNAGGTGKFRLDLVDNGSITDLSDNSLGGPGAGNFYVRGASYSRISAPLIIPALRNGLGARTIVETSENSGVGGSFLTFVPDGSIFFGDMPWRAQAKSILTFDSSVLPDNAIVVDAKINLPLIKKIGAPTNLSNSQFYYVAYQAYVEISQNGFGANDWPEYDDFEGPASAESTYPISLNTGSSLESNLLPYFNTTGSTEFRVHTYKDDNNNNVQDGYYIATGRSTIKPTITVQYVLPDSYDLTADPTHPSSGYVSCGPDFTYCNLTGSHIVMYGANGIYAVATVDGPFHCLPASHSSGTYPIVVPVQDPLPGVAKTCYVKDNAVPAASIIGIGLGNTLWTRTTLNSPWVEVPGSGSVIGVTVMQDGTILGVRSDNKLWTRATLNSPWVEVPNSGWLKAVTIMQDGTILGVHMDNMLWTRATLNSPWVQVPNSGWLIGVSIMQDGTILGVGADNQLWTRATLNSSWVEVPNSGWLKAVTVMHDGTILGAHMDNMLWTRATLNSPWVQVPDSGSVIAVARCSYYHWQLCQ